MSANFHPSQRLQVDLSPKIRGLHEIPQLGIPRWHFLVGMKWVNVEKYAFPVFCRLLFMSTLFNYTSGSSSFPK